MQNVKNFMKVMEGLARSMIGALSGGRWALGTEQSSVLCRVRHPHIRAWRLLLTQAPRRLLPSDNHESGTHFQTSPRKSGSVPG